MMKQISTFIIALTILGSYAVEIRNFKIPDLVEYGKLDEVILDCDYDLLEEDKSGLVIMWFFNNNMNPFLQWIPGRDPQIVDERFKDHLDLNFTINNKELTKHRALKLKRPLPSLSGTYKCKVSSLVDEDFKQKEMIIFAPISNVKFTQENLGNSTNLTCAVTGVAPEPSLSISWLSGLNHTEAFTEMLRIQSNSEDSNLFDAVLSLQVDNSEIWAKSGHSQIEFQCEIRLSENSVIETEELKVIERSLFSPFSGESNPLGSQNSSGSLCGCILTLACVLLMSLAPTTVF